MNHLLLVAKVLKFFLERKTGKTVEAWVTQHKDPESLEVPTPQEVSARRGALTVWETIMNWLLNFFSSTSDLHL